LITSIFPPRRNDLDHHRRIAETRTTSDEISTEQPDEVESLRPDLLDPLLEVRLLGFIHEEYSPDVSADCDWPHDSLRSSSSIVPSRWRRYQRE